MKRYMFGLGSDLSSSAKQLADLGYDGVVLGGNLAAFEAAQQAGLETWLCYGAHSLGQFSSQTHGAVDANGEPAPWFGSACPNAAEVNEANLQRAIELAQKAGVKGIFVDGARFASFASTEGLFSFFGCFCDRCMAKMKDYGMEAAAIRAGVSDVIAYLKGDSTKNDVAAMHAALQAMLAFRERCVGEYMRAFAQRAHEAGFQAAAFVFAPSLGRFVGQTAEALTSLDVVSPMLYRSYPHKDGPACMNHEWAGFQRLLGQSKTGIALFDTPIPCENPMSGFSPEAVAKEVRAMRSVLPSRIRLLPILQTEDDELERTVQLSMQAGADGCGEFAFSLKTDFAPLPK